MLIISKFHDYYDRVRSLGIDKSVVYKRLTDETNWPSYQSTVTSYTFPQQKMERDWWHVSLFCHEVGFCGTWYPLVKVEASTSAWPNSLAPSVLYDAERLGLFLRDIHVEDHGYYRSHRDNNRAGLIRSERGREEYFKPYEDDRLFVRHKCPVILRHRDAFILNPRLAEWQFQKVKNPQQAFQEIYMYISGVLGTSGREMVEISDKDRIHKHGFDKWSFRKMPEARR